MGEMTTRPTQQQAAETYRDLQHTAAGEQPGPQFSPVVDDDAAQMEYNRAWAAAHPNARRLNPGVVACFALGAPLCFVCLPALLAGPSVWAVAGSVLGVTLLALGWLATERGR